jgi:hypothetical protein
MYGHPGLVSKQARALSPAFFVPVTEMELLCGLAAARVRRGQRAPFYWSAARPVLKSGSVCNTRTLSNGLDFGGRS